MLIPSLAKINLGLRVLGKRPDGFHEIETLFQTISVKDNLRLDVTDRGIHFTTNSEWCPGDESNLVVKAAKLLQKASDTNLGCNIHLEKNIPSGAGLGGGSSNAAATLVALNRLWGLGQNEATLSALGAELGSDVPFFIRGGTALGTGRGEELQALQLNIPYWGVLICPKVHIATPWAYKQLNLDLTKSFKNSKFSVFTSQSMPAINNWQDMLVNDFESIVYQQHPELAKIPTWLQKSGAFYASMSGSGSSIFGLFTEKNAAQACKEKLAEQFDTLYLFQPVYN